MIICYFAYTVSLFVDDNIFIIYNDNIGGVSMSMAQPIRIALVKRGNLPEAELARRLGIAPQSLNAKMKRDNFTEKDLRAIAEALGLKLEISFIDPETGEKI